MLNSAPITLSQLQGAVKATLAERFALPVWVVAEIAELKVNYSGHCYLELIEKGASDGVPKAQARGVIWRSYYPRLATGFELATGQSLAAGLRILFKATVNYHELYGFSLQISDIDPAYTMGEMERKRQETIARLKAEGVWEMNHEVALPTVVQRIAIISSRKAAGYQDFCNELAASRYAFTLQLFDATMQGELAESSIISALGEVADKQCGFDAVVVIRGGGSASDLNCFNSYRLCNHIAQFPLPVITGIGHDKDVSVADMVAHTSLKTPTAVAGWLTERMTRIEGWLDGAALALHDGALRLSKSHLMHLERLHEELKGQAQGLIEHQRRELDAVSRRLPDEALRLLRREAERLHHLEKLTESHSPHRILQLGFSITRQQGHALKSPSEADPSQPLDIELATGHLEAHIK